MICMTTLSLNALFATFTPVSVLSKTNHNIVTSKMLFGGVRVAHLFIFCVLSYYMSLHSEFRFVMSGTIST
jgi:hypothetical protein